jgi:predicted PurR-regulated permease PerM
MSDANREAPEERDGATRLARLHLWQIQGVRDVVVVAVVLAIVYLGYAMRSVSVPLLVAFGLAYLVEPVVQGLVRRFNMTRTAAVGTLMGTAGVALVAVLAIMLPIVVGQSASFVQAFRQGRFNKALERTEQLVPEQYRGEVERVKEWFSSNVSPAPVGVSNAGAKNAELKHEGDEAKPLEPVAASAKEPAGEAAVTAKAEREVAIKEADAIQRAVAAELDRRGLVSARTDRAGFQWGALLGSSAEQVLVTAVDVLTVGFLTALVPFYFWFFSISFPAALDFLRGLLPVRHRDRVIELAVEMDRAVSGFVRGRIVVSSIMGVLIAVGWKFFGVPYAITLGVVVGVFSLVPYLSVVGLPIAIGLLAVDQLALPEADRMTWFWILIGPTLVYGIVQFLEGYVLIPLIAGKATDLDPVSIFVAVLAGAAIAGVYGMLLSIPVAACLKIYLREVVMPHLRDWSSGRADDPLPLDQG